MKPFTIVLVAVSAGILSASGLRAESPPDSGRVLAVKGDQGDCAADRNGKPWDEHSPSLRVGCGGDDLRGIAAVFFFPLPKLSSQNALTAAELDLRYLGATRGSRGNSAPPDFAAELYGLGGRTTPTTQATDFPKGKQDSPSARLITRGLLSPDTPAGPVKASGAELRDYLASLYRPDGTPTAPYVAFRVSADVEFPPADRRYRGYELATADNADENGKYVPLLTLTTGPEPVAPEPAKADVWVLVLVAGVASAVIAVLGWLLVRARRANRGGTPRP